MKAIKNYRLNIMKWFFVYMFIFLLTSTIVAQQSPPLSFSQVSLKEGLSSKLIIDFAQDTSGFIWIGTENGLNKYDGYTVKIFKTNSYDNTSISSNMIHRVFVDIYNNVWIGTDHGLNRFNHDTENFSFFSLNEENILSSNANKIFVIFQDKEGNLYVVPESGDIYLYNYSTKVFNKAFDFKIKNNVKCSFKDSDNNFWFGTSNGLIKYDNRSKKLIEYYPKDFDSWNAGEIWQIVEYNTKIYFGTLGGGLLELNPNTGMITNCNFIRNSEYVYGLLIDKENKFWIGSSSGLMLYNPVKNDFYLYKSNIYDSQSLSGNKVFKIKNDFQGNLLVGTDDGLNISYHKKAFYKLFNENIPYKLSSINSFAIDQSGNYWLGFTDSIRMISKENHTIKSFKTYTASDLAYGDVKKIFTAKDGTIYAGAYKRGLLEYIPDRDAFYEYTHDSANKSSISGLDVRAIEEAQDGILWVGCHGYGLNKFDPKTGLFKRYTSEPNNPKSLSDNWIFSLKLTSEGDLWVGNALGISKFNKDSQTFHNYLPNPNDHKSISNRAIVVTTIFEDHLGRIWLGTQRGLKLYDPKNDNFVHYNAFDGLANDNISNILEDENGNLWLSTDEGISKFTPSDNPYDKSKKSIIKNFDKSDGLISSKFMPGFSYKDDNGMLYFGGDEGITVFYPKEIVDNQYIPKIKFTDFKILHESVDVWEEKSPNNNKDFHLENHIDYLESIKLKYFQNTITFEYLAINYIQSWKNKYAYKLEGFDKDWNYVDNDRKATYTNLSPGVYTFRVKASNNDGKWNESGRSMKIFIAPPWWKTWWFYLICISTILIILLWLRSRFVKNLELKKEQELNQMKIRFFMNISHEFKSPLTLILGPITEMLREENTTDRKNNLNMMKRNAWRLLHLVNQLLDFRRLETNSLKLNMREKDIVEFLRYLFESFNYLALRKNISISFESSLPSFTCHFDPDIVEKIFNNLVSNAFKYTPENRSIHIKIEVKNYSSFKTKIRKKVKSTYTPEKMEFLVVSVIDSGVGIESGKLDKIFERFYRIEDNIISKQSGTGIGLSHSKELANLHKGDIIVESQKESGSNFSFYFPLFKEAYCAEDYIEDNIYPELIEESDIETNIGLSKKTDLISKKAERETILVIDDNPDIRLFIRQNLKNIYTIIEAKDGIEGLEKAIHTIPDLIISDIMMPVMDGIELVKEIKNNINTCHIPFIFVTARTSDESQLEALKVGIDDYLIKPFNIDILKIKILNLIDNRQKLRTYFSSNPFIQSDKFTLNSIDKDFIDKMILTINEKMNDPEYGPNQLASDMAMSRSQFYRKVKAITGQPVFDFIKTVKLNDAAKILSNQNIPILEVSEKVGFKNSKHFSTAFAKKFGVPPSKYINKK